MVRGSLNYYTDLVRHGPLAAAVSANEKQVLRLLTNERRVLPANAVSMPNGAHQQHESQHEPLL